MEQITFEIETQEDAEGFWRFQLYQRTAMCLPNFRYPIITKKLLVEHDCFVSEQDALDDAHCWLRIRNNNQWH